MDICLAEAAAPSDSLVFGRRVQIYTYLLSVQFSCLFKLRAIGLPGSEEYYFMYVNISQRSWVACLHSIVRHLCLVRCSYVCSLVPHRH